MPNSETFVGFENYLNGLSSSGFFISFIRSVWVSIASVLVIIVCTSMASWFITAFTLSSVSFPLEVDRNVTYFEHSPYSFFLAIEAESPLAFSTRRLISYVFFLASEGF